MCTLVIFYMLSTYKDNIQEFIQSTLQASFPDVAEWPAIELEVPADKKHGHFSCNIALRCAKPLRKAPPVIAADFVGALEQALNGSNLNHIIDKIEVKNPGFINFFLTSQSLTATIAEIYAQGEAFGQVDIGQGRKIGIEFVSANPTGPLSIAHARQAAVGDALGNILKAIGFDVTKEYYVNDGGNQIRMLGQSLKLRMLEMVQPDTEFPEDCYQGEYMKDIARGVFEFKDQVTEKTLAELSDCQADISAFDTDFVNGYSDEQFQDWSKSLIMDDIKKDLADFNVHFDVWSLESEVASPEKIVGLIERLTADGYLYEKDGALWFKSTDFGDDKDRVIRKSDSTYTYLTPDIVYHKNKFERGFDQVIDILGPDHHGYIARIKASAQALGRQADDLQVLIVQLATIFRDGQAVSMSTRRGQYVSLREILDEVGADVARYFFLMRHIKAHLEFDLELAKKESSENPVYYIQYAYARINSINKKASESEIDLERQDFSRLSTEEELDLAKQLGGYSDALAYCHQQLDPYPLVNYLFELATVFHKFYDRQRVIDSDTQLSAQRLGLVNAVKTVLGNGLALLGISRPDSM